jgi:lipoprotein-anchoring transpeptidase ErfK/SrfK
MTSSTTTAFWGRHKGVLAWSAVLLTVGLSTSACQSVTPDAAAEGTPSASSTPSVTTSPAASLSVTPADGAKSVRPDAPVTVSVQNGTISDVQVTADGAGEVTGELSADKTVWTSSSGLKPKTTYHVAATAVNAEGKSTSISSTLRTLTPKDTANYTVIPSSGVVGVGMPVVIQFVSPVDAAKRAEVERRVKVTATPAVTGQWGWLDGRQLIFRPSKYWKPGTKVTVDADIAGIETKPSLWTSAGSHNTFTIGSAMVSTVNTQTHRMTVTQNGKVLRTLKVSTGRPGSKTETRSGVKVILSRESEHIMDSTTVGIPKGQPGYYRLKTEWAMRLTWSGEFLHSAPWSVGSQGSANVSHGCTNLSPSDAKWLFDHSKMGDVVKFVGSSRGLEEYNGYTMWNETAAQWAKKSAI